MTLKFIKLHAYRENLIIHTCVCAVRVGFCKTICHPSLRHSLFILFLLLTCKDTKFLSEMQVFPTLFHSEVTATSSCPRSDGIFGCFRRHLWLVPMILYSPKVSSERPQNAIGTGARNVRNDPKVTTPQLRCNSDLTPMQLPLFFEKCIIFPQLLKNLTFP